MSVLAERIEQTRADTDLAPSDAQREAGNYRKGRFFWKGLPLTIENPRGSTRSGTSKFGKSWSTEMRHDYGYIRRTESEADGDHIDIFMGPDHDSELVFVVDQTKPGSEAFDEHKVMLGFTSRIAAKRGYLESYSAGWDGFRAITPMTLDEFKEWIDSGDTSKPVVQYSRDTETIHYRATHAPHNITLNGKDFKGGQFIPSSDIAAASPQERKQLLDATGQTGDLPQRTKAAQSHQDKIHPQFADAFKKFHVDPEFQKSGTLYSKNFDEEHAADMYDQMRQNAGKDFGGGKVVDLGGGRMGFASSAGSVVVAPNRQKPGQWKVAYTVHTKMVDQAHGLKGPGEAKPSPWSQTPLNLGGGGSKQTPNLADTQEYQPESSGNLTPQQPEATPATPAPIVQPAIAKPSAPQPVAAPDAPAITGKPPHEMTRDEFAAQLPASQHKQHIKAALKAGKNVPLNVLAEYPELTREHLKSITGGDSDLFDRPKPPGGVSDTDQAAPAASQPASAPVDVQPADRLSEKAAISAPPGDKTVNGKVADPTYQNPRKGGGQPKAPANDWQNKAPWEMTPEEYGKSSFDQGLSHEARIRNRLTIGGSVPKEILSHYPHLQQAKPRDEALAAMAKRKTPKAPTVLESDEEPKKPRAKLSPAEKLKGSVAGHMMTGGLAGEHNLQDLLHAAIDKYHLRSHADVKRAIKSLMRSRGDGKQDPNDVVSLVDLLRDDHAHAFSRSDVAQHFKKDASGHEHKGKGPGGGEFTGSGGSSAATPVTAGKPSGKRTPAPKLSEKAQRAKDNHVLIDKDIQRYAEEHNEPHFAKAVGGVSFPDGEPIDVAVAGENGVVAHGIELKTMVINSNNKITMKREAMERKAAWEKKNKAPVHTVVLDDSAVYNANGHGDHDESKRRIFYRRGYGSFRVGTMHEVKDLAELKQLMDTSESKLPLAAQRPKGQAQGKLA